MNVILKARVIEFGVFIKSLEGFENVLSLMILLHVNVILKDSRVVEFFVFIKSSREFENVLFLMVVFL